ncbi:MAG: VWA domain-containing protein [Dehalococcoidia bacterium]
MQRLNSERSQVLPIMALLCVALIGLMGLALDIGRIVIARAELSRALDSAALAGVVELPNVDAAQDRAAVYMDDNLPTSTISFPATEQEYQFRVQGERTVDLIFMGIFGFGETAIDAQAAAGYGIIPVDAMVTLDATGSMHTGCNADETNTGGACPIKEARDAASLFADILLPNTPTSTTTKVASGAFRGCYDPPRDNVKCIPTSVIQALTNNQTTIINGISNIHAVGATGQPTGGSGTNICQALKKVQDTIFGAGSHTETNTLRFVVILSDGDSVYNATQVNQTSPQSPESPCRPTNPSTNDGDVSANCLNTTQTQEAKVDRLSKTQADNIRLQGVEIYVVAFSVCGGAGAHTGTCPTNSSTVIGQTGSSFPDSLTDHVLLKCIASSKSGTNDHYFETSTASELPGIFEQIARSITYRLTE